MKLSYLAIFVFLSLSLVQVRAQNPRTAENFMDGGLERQSKGDLDGAIDARSGNPAGKPRERC